MTEYELGAGQIRVMRVLWEKRRATAQDVIDELSKEEPIKRSTVQTFLRALVKKGVVGYDVEDRTFVYYPVVEEKDVAQHAFQRFLEHMFEGSLEGFLSFFAKNRYVPPEKMEKIRMMLENEDD